MTDNTQPGHEKYGGMRPDSHYDEMASRPESARFVADGDAFEFEPPPEGWGEEPRAAEETKGGKETKGVRP